MIVTRTKAARGALVMLTLLATSWLAAVPRAAVAQPAAQMRLIDQTLLVEPNGVASFHLDVSGAVPEDAVIDLVVNGALAPASTGVLKAIAGDITAPTVAFITYPVAELVRDDAGRVVLDIPTVVRLRDRKPDNIRLAAVGVYAVTLELRSERRGTPLQQIVTFLVRTNAATEPSPVLNVAMVLPADSPPTMQPDGSTEIAPGDRQRL
ncbi:MAG TPA: hypothetical protein VF855_14385, partial [Acidimicrobiales bacterium]